MSNPSDYFMFFLGLEAQINLATKNSKIHNVRFEIITWKPFSFTYNYLLIPPFSPDILSDIDDINNSGAVSDDLYNYGCDFAIILTNQGYVDPQTQSQPIYGVAGGYGPGPRRAIIEIPTASSTNVVFSHEVGHLMGGRHQFAIDFTSGCNHAYKISNQESTYDYTIIANIAIPDNHILYYSNPFVYVNGQRLGTEQDNNAVAFKNNGCWIENLEPDPYWYCDIIGEDIICDISPTDLVFEAEVNMGSPFNEGTPPYKYIWQYGYVWNETNFPNYNFQWAPDEGSTLTIPYDPIQGNLELFVRLIVGDDGGDDDWDHFIMKVNHIILMAAGCDPDPGLPPHEWEPRSDTSHLNNTDQCNYFTQFSYDQNNINAEIFNTSINSHSISTSFFQLVTMTGLVALSGKLNGIGNSTIDISSLPQGVYYFKVETPCNTAPFKIFKL